MIKLFGLRILTKKEYQEKAINSMVLKRAYDRANQEVDFLNEEINKLKGSAKNA